MENIKDKNEKMTAFSLFLLKRELQIILKQKLFYVAAIFFVIITSFFHFIAGNFFSLDLGSSSLSQFFLSMPYICILVIPTLTMNVWNLKNDTFESFPISTTKKVFVKFLALILLFLLILIFTLPVVFFTNSFGNVSFSSVFTGYFVIFLYGSCVISLCLFIFSFFQNKALAFFSAAIILAIINSSHFLPLYFNLPSFLATFARSLSVSWHFDAASKGILDTRDCLFYVILSALFCVLTVYHINSRKKGNFNKQVIFFPIIALLLILNSTLYYTRLDLTSEKQFTLEKDSSETLENLLSPLEITYYLSPELENIYPQVRDVKDFLYQLSYKNKLISVKVVNPKEKSLENALANLGIVSQQIQTTEENKTSFVQVYSSILLEYSGKYKTIPFVISTSELEYNLLTRIKSLSSNFQMEALLISGNGLSFDKEYSYVIPWFEAAGFSPKIISAPDLDKTFVAPNQCLVVLGSSKLTLNDAVSIESYLQRGGKALFAVSPNTVDITSTWAATNEGYDPIIDMLTTWGFSIGNEIIQDISNYRLRMYATNPDNSIDYNNSIYVNYPFWLVTLPQFVNNEFIVTKNFSSFESYWSSPITLKKTGNGEYTPLIFTSQLAWLQAPYSITESQAFVTDPLSSANTKPSNIENGQYLIAATFSGDLPAYYLTNGIENTKITVISDQYFPSTVIENTNSPNNLNFLISNALYLSGNENLISVKNKGLTNTSLYKITDSSDFKKQMILTNLTVFLFVPLMILALYIFQIIYRKVQNQKAKERFLQGEKQ